MNFGKILKNLRNKKGISIKKLAPEVGLDYTYLSKLENSKVNPSNEVIEKFSHYFNFDLDQLSISAGKVPEDIKDILMNNSKEAVGLLRKRFGNNNNT